MKIVTNLDIFNIEKRGWSLRSTDKRPVFFAFHSSHSKGQRRMSQKQKWHGERRRKVHEWLVTLTLGVDLSNAKNEMQRRRAVYPSIANFNLVFLCWRYRDSSRFLSRRGNLMRRIRKSNKIFGMTTFRGRKCIFKTKNRFLTVKSNSKRNKWNIFGISVIFSIS